MVENTYSFDDILIKPKAYSSVKSRGDVDTSVSLYGNIGLLVPILSASMSAFDTFENTRDIYYKFAASMHEAGGMHIFSRATLFSERLKAVQSLSATGVQCGIAVSTSEFETFREELFTLPPNTVVSIDIANGSILENITWGGDYNIPHPTLIIGNFGNPAAVIRRDFLGQIVFKMGIGSGSGCTTRLATGVGAPQAWLVQESSKISRKPVISDGGITQPSDFAKALALGADLVMIGKLLASAKETPWAPVKLDGKWYKPYRGMASKEEKGVTEHIEGKSGYVPYEEKPIFQIVAELKQGLASAMSYSDAHNLLEFKQRAEFLRVTPLTVIENGTRLYSAH